MKDPRSDRRQRRRRRRLRNRLRFYAVIALFCAWVGLLGIMAYGLLMWDFLFPATFRGEAWMKASGMQIDVVLLLLFAVQHSGMASPRFKSWWTQYIPPRLEPSVYVMFAGFFLFVLSSLWRPVLPPLYDLNGHWAGGLLLGLNGLGYLIILISQWKMDPFGLLGLRQCVEFILNKKPPSPDFRTPLLYNWTRHPLYLGLLFTWWFSPALTPDHLLFNAVMTLYILVGISFEERKMVDQFGEEYEAYQRRVPMLIPNPFASKN